MDPGKAGAAPSHHRVCSTEPGLSTGTPSSASSRVRRIGHGRTRGGDRALGRAHDTFALAIPAGGVAPCCLRPAGAAICCATGLKSPGREDHAAAGAHGQATRDGGDKGKLEADRGEEAIACEHQRMRSTERHPRELVIAPDEAAVVRRVWHELTQHSLAEVAELLNLDGVPHRQGGAWTRESVKDVVRRGRMYLGLVVEKRGRDERPGRHEPILTEAEYHRTMAAIASRRRVGNKPRPFRSYVLRGLLYCTCGTRMRGEAHLQRGTEPRYYRCPTLDCRVRRSPADYLEEAVLATIAEAVLPGSVIDAARTELRRRLETPEVAVAGRQRARLLTQLEQLKKQRGWGDLGDAEYQAQRDAVRTALAALPDEDRIRSFDAYRARVLALPEAIAVASPARREELCRILVERVVVRDRQLETIDRTPSDRPFFKRQREYPQGALRPRPLSDDSSLAWYVA